MAPKKSLLRYIFRHGPHTKARSEKSSAKQTSYTSRTTPEPHFTQQHATPDGAPDSPLAYKSRSESRQSAVLENIVEESGSDNGNDGSDVDSASLTGSLAALGFDIESFTTRSLVAASLDEARMGNHAHLMTIDTTLALLDALHGFSATIEVLREEMAGKRQVCEEKLAMLEDVQRAVGQMQFGDELIEKNDTPE
jgi:hypothetical protein